MSNSQVAAAVVTGLAAASDLINQVTLVDNNYNFRKNQETGYKRPTVEVKVPVPTADALVAALQSEDVKLKSLILDTIAGVVISHTRGFIDADANFTQDTLDALAADGKLSIVAISQIERGERNVLSREDLEAFAVDYIEVMVGIRGEADRAKVEKGASLYVQRFNPVKGDEKILAYLQDQLLQYADKAGEEVLVRHERVLNNLVARLEDLLSANLTIDAL